MKQILLLPIIFALLLFPCLAQINKSEKRKLNKSKINNKNPVLPTSKIEKQERKTDGRDLDEASIYARIRYVIVYNWIFNGLAVPERRMDVLIDEKQFNEGSLKTIFDLIKKRFPEPLRLQITVHTSLATVETPEENEMLRDSIDSRFSHTYSKYKKAFYMRFEWGREGFNYTENLSPYSERQVVLVDKKMPKDLYNNKY